MQLDGLATGMDTTAVIDQLVALEQRPILNYQQEISELEQTKGAWRDINSRLDNLSGKATDLKLSSTFNSRTANSTDKDVVTATASNNSNEANYSITVHEVAKSQRIFGGQLEGYSAGYDDTITINSSEIDIKTGDTLGDISNKINDSEAGVKASIVDNRLVLETTETGIDNVLKGEGDVADPADSNFSSSGDILKDLGLISNDTQSIVNEAQEASDALIDINGITGITNSSNSFSEVVEGITFEINPNAEVDSNAGVTASADINVTKDTAKATKAVQGFVDQYNSVMNFIDGKTNYDEDENKGAVLQGDSTAMRLQTRLRSLVTSQVKDSGDFNTLSSIGIEIDRQGVMSFDKSKFTEALEESSEEVMSIFNGESESDGFDGMAVKIDSYLDQLMQSNTGLIPRRLDFYDNRIDSLNDDIEDVQRSVELTRERYVEQFAAMESAISEMNQQMSWMQSQLSSLSGSTSMLSGNN